MQIPFHHIPKVQEFTVEYSELIDMFKKVWDDLSFCDMVCYAGRSRQQVSALWS